jgi:diadenosine tetraphosphatase ApaH/serine/threonine PP2A family protein phosphatase
VIGVLSVADFNGDAAAAVRWTQSVLADDARSFLTTLAPAATRNGAALFHGSPLDPVWDYVLSEGGARASMESVDAPLVMVGHSHVALRISYDDGALSGGLAYNGDEVDLSDPRAAWLTIDFDARRAWFRRTAYPIELTQRGIREAGLPDGLATRLRLGQ